jgi:hypothetical protein
MSQQLQPFSDVQGELYAELGEVASFNRSYRAGLKSGVLVRQGRGYFVPTDKKAVIRDIVLALPRRRPAAA